MIVDSSALVALVLREPGWERIATELTRRTHAAIGAPTRTSGTVAAATRRRSTSAIA